MTTIREHTRQCFQLFDRWIEAVSSRDSIFDAIPPSSFGGQGEDNSAWRETATAEATILTATPVGLVELENDLFRFTLWADHYSATSSGRDSLDWRLRKSSVTHSVVLDLLEDLAQAIFGKWDNRITRNNLNTLFTAKLGPVQASAGESQDLPGIVLDRLFRYSRVIRRSGAMKRLAKASDFIECDGNVNLTSEFRKTAAQVLDVILNQAADIIFRDRLLDTMCIRQQSFAYQKSCRENKLKPPVDVVVVPPKSNSGSRTGSAYRVKIGFATTAPSTTRSQKIAPRKSLGVTPMLRAGAA
jgi:hypothetical protein